MNPPENPEPGDGDAFDAYLDAVDDFISMVDAPQELEIKAQAITLIVETTQYLHEQSD